MSAQGARETIRIPAPLWQNESVQPGIGAGASQGDFMRNKLTILIAIAAVAGVLAGYLANNLAADAAAAASIAGYFSILADIFLRLIKMIIAPLAIIMVLSMRRTTAQSPLIDESTPLFWLGPHAHVSSFVRRFSGVSLLILLEVDRDPARPRVRRCEI